VLSGDNDKITQGTLNGQSAASIALDRKSRPAFAQGRVLGEGKAGRHEHARLCREGTNAPGKLGEEARLALRFERIAHKRKKK
jgi:hypothetical protein